LKPRILVLALVALAVCFVPAAAHVAQAKPNTTVPDVYQDVDVTISDTRITLSEKSGDRGGGVNFHVRNVGKRVHNFALLAPGAAIIGLGREGLTTANLKPKQTAVLQVFLDYVGTFVYRSTLRADRPKPGMHGKFEVTANGGAAG
jgi:hypothetical protein